MTVQEALRYAQGTMALVDRYELSPLIAEIEARISRGELTIDDAITEIRQH
jgi:hypothetical protein